MASLKMSRLERNFLALVLALSVVLFAIGLYAFQQVTDNVIENWGQRMAENQVRYNSSRLLQPLEREIGLAQQMANSPTLVAWAQDPEDRQLYSAAMRELESFRQNFKSRNYFLALTKTHDYYHNNEANEFLGQELRYRLRDNRPADAWFFGLIEEGRDFHININPDVELGVTKLWIDVLMRDPEGRILAVLGTGLPLDEIISDLIVPSQSGVIGLFVDTQGAIQLYQDRRLIDFASFVQPEGQKRTLDLVVDLPEEGRMLLNTIQQMRQKPEVSQEIVTRYVTIGGERHLVGISFLPSIGWFDVTFLNLSEIMPNDRFWPLAGVLLLSLVLILVGIHFALRREILLPLATLSQQMDKLGRKEGYKTDIENVHKGELGQIFDHFSAMAKLVHANFETLETMVEQRTRELEIKAREDSLTGLLNRGAMTIILDQQSEKSARTGEPFGIIWIDIDNFKLVNDTHGHATGDLVLQELGRELRKGLRVYDHAARWGGDEFLVLLSPCEDTLLQVVSERLRQTTKQNPTFSRYGITVSTGAVMLHADETYEEALARADIQLYRAKATNTDTKAS